nr:AMP-binding protein [Ancylobacter crimeensis]
MARSAPARIALTCEEERLTRAALAAGIGARATGLAAFTARGASVALDLPNGVELAMAFLACAISGREALVYDPGWPSSYRAALDAALAPAWTLSGGDHWPDIPQWPAPPQGDPPFYVGFTSGSTGVPKGYRRAHRSWIESFAVSEGEFGIGPDDVVMAPGGLAASLHLYGVVHALHIGAEAVMMRRFHPRRALDLVEARFVTVLYATPTQLQMLAEAGEGRAFASVRLILTSGAKGQPGYRDAVERLFPAARLGEFYGASELSFVTIAHPDEAVPAGSVGRAARGVTLAIRDEAGRALPPGSVGRVWVKSGMLFSGYATGGEVIARDGAFVSVGDHGALDAAGFLTLHGREKRMLVTGGLNVYPEEVEAVLIRAPGVAEAVVFGVEDELRGTTLIAVLRMDGLPEEPALRAHCRALLPTAKVPRRFLGLPDFPRTSGGKVDLVALRRQVEARTGWVLR